MKARLTAFVIWAAVAASAMFWALRLAASSPAAPVHTVSVSAAALPRGDLTRVFGAAPERPVGDGAVIVESPLSSRFRLLGVAAPRQGGDRNGLALIAVDGKPARSYAVGASVDGDLLLQSVHARGAKLGARGADARLSLNLPALPPPATGNLPVASAFGAPVPGVNVGARVSAPISLSPLAPSIGVPTEPQQGEPIAVPPPPGSNTR